MFGGAPEAHEVFSRSDTGHKTRPLRVHIDGTVTPTMIGQVVSHYGIIKMTRLRSSAFSVARLRKLTARSTVDIARRGISY